MLRSALLIISEVLVLGAQLVKLYKEARKKKWIKEGRALSQRIAEAKTDEERAKLARALFDHRAD